MIKIIENQRLSCKNFVKIGGKCWKMGENSPTAGEKVKISIKMDKKSEKWLCCFSSSPLRISLFQIGLEFWNMCVSLAFRPFQISCIWLVALISNSLGRIELESWNSAGRPCMMVVSSTYSQRMKIFKEHNQNDYTSIKLYFRLIYRYLCEIHVWFWF